MTAVSNSSPLIYLAALSDFELLPRLFGNVKIPTAVWREVVEQGEAYPVCTVKPKVDQLRTTTFRLSDCDYQAVLEAVNEWP